MKIILTAAILIFSNLQLFGQDTLSLHSAGPVFGIYDPIADPELQLQSAVNEATKANKRILLDIGGEWCKWCHYLDNFFESNPDVTTFLKEHYILVKINFSKENLNEQFLSKFPKIPGYPHFFVLEKDATFLHSQETGSLEKGKGHDHDKVLTFLTNWARME